MSVLTATCDSKPASSARCTASGFASAVANGNFKLLHILVSCRRTSIHSMIRSGERKRCLHIFRNCEFDNCFFCTVTKFQRFNHARKSDVSTLNSACISSEASRFSNGRSRGSCTDSALTIVNTSFTQPSSAAANSIRPRRGSIGKRAKRLPISVSWRLSFSAPSSCKVR